MFSMVAYFQNGDFANADTLLNGVQDQSIFVSGKDVRIQKGWENLLAEYVTTVAATRNYASVQSPSMRRLVNQDLGVFGSVVTSIADTSIQWHPQAPRVLETDESVNFLVNTDDAAVQDHYAAIWLGDGPVQPVNGKIFTIRCTATIQQVAGVWTAGQMTFSQKLPVEDYQVVGMRFSAATGIAARLIFPGSGFRPGVLNSGQNSIADVGRFRNGNMGVWGQFNLNAPPQLEVLAGVAAAQLVFLDLIRMG